MPRHTTILSCCPSLVAPLVSLISMKPSRVCSFSCLQSFTHVHLGPSPKPAISWHSVRSKILLAVISLGFQMWGRPRIKLLLAHPADAWLDYNQLHLKVRSILGRCIRLLESFSAQSSMWITLLCTRLLLPGSCVATEVCLVCSSLYLDVIYQNNIQINANPWVFFYLFVEHSITTR